MPATWGRRAIPFECKNPRIRPGGRQSARFMRHWRSGKLYFFFLVVQAWAKAPVRGGPARATGCKTRPIVLMQTQAGRAAPAYQHRVREDFWSP